jgi:hypothetical protein
MTAHKHNDDIKEELRIIDIGTAVKTYPTKWLEHLE